MDTTRVDYTSPTRCLARLDSSPGTVLVVPLARVIDITGIPRKGVRMRLSRWGISIAGALVLGLVLLVGWSAASPTAAPAQAKVGAATIKVGLITKTETNPFFVKMKEGAQK